MHDFARTLPHICRPPHTQKVIDHFGRGLLHCHSRALYLVPEISALDKAVNIWVATDPNETRPIDVLKTLIAQADGGWAFL